MLNDIIQSIIGNQIVTGLSASAILGGLMYQLKEIPSKIGNLIVGQCVVKVSIVNLDPSYIWLEKWITTQKFLIKPRALTLKANDVEGDDDDEFRQGPKKWAMTPGKGTHIFRFKSTLAWVSKEIKEIEKMNMGGPQLETMTITVLTRNSSTLKALIDEAHQFAQLTTSIPIYMYKGWWHKINGKEIRDLDTIVLNEGQLDSILADLDWYNGAKDWYRERGIPYRRGYLFSGPPGTGKSSLVFALAGYLRRPLCVLNLGSIESDNDLFAAIIDSPPNAILLIEDVDCSRVSTQRKITRPKVVDITDSDKEDDEGEAKGVSKAGLLNALDGIMTPENRIFVMTTNHPENLDTALIRPGRADVHEKILNLEPDAQSILASKFYGPNLFETLPYSVAPVIIQAACMLYPNDPVKARDYIVNLDSVKD